MKESILGGALGLSTNRNERHMREDGLPVPSRLATEDELLALCDVRRVEQRRDSDQPWAPLRRADSRNTKRSRGVRAGRSSGRACVQGASPSSGKICSTA